MERSSVLLPLRRFSDILGASLEDVASLLEVRVWPGDGNPTPDATARIGVFGGGGIVIVMPENGVFGEGAVEIGVPKNGAFAGGSISDNGVFETSRFEGEFSSSMLPWVKVCCLRRSVVNNVVRASKNFTISLGLPQREGAQFAFNCGNGGSC